MVKVITGGKARYNTIPVSADVYRRLLHIKEKRNKKTWNELIEELLSVYEEFRRVNLIKTLCNDLRESSASLPAWFKLLRSRLGDEELATDALSYLKQKDNEPGIFIVDISKCS